MLTDKQWTDIDRLTDQDVNRLRLRYHGDKAMAESIDQIECRRRTLKKLPDTLGKAPRFEFPSVLSTEQSTSDAIAAYHASLMPPGARILDMTCGLGIDTFHFARRASQVTAYDIMERNCIYAAHNARLLGLTNVEVRCGDSAAGLMELAPDSFDCIFIDPARRGDHGKRLYALADCSPDVTELIGGMLRVAPTVIVKASPMLDLNHTVNELKHVKAITAVGTTRECKELIIVCHRHDDGAAMRGSVTLGHDFSITHHFRAEDERIAGPTYGTPAIGQILHEPYPAAIKAGGIKTLATDFGLVKIAPNSHLYFADNRVEDFPGRALEIVDVIPYNKKGIKAIRATAERMDVTARNFPLTPDALYRKLKIKPGGELRLFATRDMSEAPLLIVATITFQTYAQSPACPHAP